MEVMYKTLLYVFINSFVFGIILAVVTYVFMSFSSHCKARLRYNVLVLFLFVFVVAVLFFGMNHISNPYQTIHHQVILPILSHNEGNYNPKAIQVSESFLFFKTLYLKIYDFALEITLVWGLIFCYKMIKLFLGIHKIKSLIFKNKIELNDDWNNKILQYCNKIGIKTNVKVYLSSAISSPAVFGFFKPIVLIPIQLTTGLSSDQLEAVIYHELVHIKRYDSIINLVQNLLEVIFFFNLPLLWLSNLIRIEREKCCDDAVLKITDNKKDYISALYFCAEMTVGKQELALGFANNNEILLDRVERIILNGQNSVNKIKTPTFHSFAIFLFALLIGYIYQLKLHNVFNILPDTSINEIAKTPVDNDYIILTGITSDTLSEKEGEKIVSVLNKMISQMSHEKLISNDAQKLSFLLDNNQLIINGELQSNEIFNRYQSKYIKKSDWRICYNYKIKK
ncbi:beta-lactamase regulating signal transducer with metallopeptidase domain [Flavobacterium sp. HSC-32F16]|uniref:M56 family metallopeptidase n=1 Tax=Flavobacterium sp. HSC-32F16 TaxID=2910964 RepID=UPI0020A61652|nr:M56 family metallopeptidase [Flavobacterium sp. HSC-32F16]MCP2028494.1 beta-lactamase regulating signal transducer with metallopeptidase domain [Flavobacterium sp. HSC-32F16]